MPTKYIEVAPQGDTLIILPEQNERHDCERTTLSSPMTPKGITKFTNKTSRAATVQIGDLLCTRLIRLRNR